MSTVINTNINSLIAQNALKVNNRAMSTAMEQLSTGQRINSAADDAAGLAIGQTMSAQSRSLAVAIRNANDGISLAQTAEGAMIEMSNMLQRMRELAVQASTGTLSTEQRGYLNTEFAALKSQINDTIEDTTWNGMAVLGSTSALSFSIQVGAESAQTISVSVDSMAPIYSAGAFAGIASTGSASTSLDQLDTALQTINSARATLGAVVNRLTSTADNLANVTQNMAESRSRVLDTDYAAATTELARTQIIQQAGTAILAQANQQPQSVLALLR
jgi:flagellin